MEEEVGVAQMPVMEHLQMQMEKPSLIQPHGGSVPSHVVGIGHVAPWHARHECAAPWPVAPVLPVDEPASASTRITRLLGPAHDIPLYTHCRSRCQHQTQARAV